MQTASPSSEGNADAVEQPSDGESADEEVPMGSDEETPVGKPLLEAFFETHREGPRLGHALYGQMKTRLVRLREVRITVHKSEVLRTHYQSRQN